MKKGNKKRLARQLRGLINIPARTICRTMKYNAIIQEITKKLVVNPEEWKKLSEWEKQRKQQLRLP